MYSDSCIIHVSLILQYLKLKVDKHVVDYLQEEDNQSYHSAVQCWGGQKSISRMIFLYLLGSDKIKQLHRGDTQW